MLFSLECFWYAAFFASGRGCGLHWLPVGLAVSPSSAISFYRAHLSLAASFRHFTSLLSTPANALPIRSSPPTQIRTALPRSPSAMAARTSPNTRRPGIGRGRLARCVLRVVWRFYSNDMILLIALRMHCFGSFGSPGSMQLCCVRYYLSIWYP
jgi:hypothetical protein